MTATKGLAMLVGVAVAGALVAASSGAPETGPVAGIARLKTISSKVSSKGASLVIEATEPVAYIDQFFNSASYWRATDIRQEVAWVSGAAMLVERAAFRGVGGFDEKLFLYKEDEDLCLRVRETGASVIYEPAVTLRHVGSVVADRHGELVGATSYFFAKHYRHERSRRAFAAAHRTLAYLRL